MNNKNVQNKNPKYNTKFANANFVKHPTFFRMIIKSTNFAAIVHIFPLFSVAQKARAWNQIKAPLAYNTYIVRRICKQRYKSKIQEQRFVGSQLNESRHLRIRLIGLLPKWIRFFAVFCAGKNGFHVAENSILTRMFRQSVCIVRENFVNIDFSFYVQLLCSNFLGLKFSILEYFEKSIVYKKYLKMVGVEA